MSDAAVTSQHDLLFGIVAYDSNDVAILLVFQLIEDRGWERQTESLDIALGKKRARHIGGSLLNL